MSILVVSYDLQSPGQSYERLYEAIQSLGVVHRAFDSVWFVKTNRTPNQAFEYLRQVLGNNDLLLVNQLSSGYMGWLQKETCDWLSNQSQAV